jgi:hypothetical protein
MAEETQSSELSFSVTRGNPSAEELAVVIAVIQAAAGSSRVGAAVSEPMSNWSRNVGLLRVPIAPGRGQWNAAYRRGLTR